MGQDDFSDHLVSSDKILADLYGVPNENALVKEIDHINPHYRAFIGAAPFLVLATNGIGGLDCSPRGDAAGFVRVHDAKTLLVPDRRGNNRIDSLRNIVHNSRAALLFLIPGCGETLRVNGCAAISTDPALLQSFAIDGKAPRTVIVFRVERVYFQCARAILRAKLWDSSLHRDRRGLPSVGTILAELSKGKVSSEVHDRNASEQIGKQLY